MTKKHGTSRRNSGFTLVEMLIVIAIIAVLTAVAIPSFSASLEKTRETTCLANRRSFTSVLQADYLLDETIDEAGMQALFEEKKDHYPCPSGGELALEFDADTGTVGVTCKLHGGTKSLADADTIKDMEDILGSVSGTRLDSGAMSFDEAKSKEAVAALKAAGIDLANLPDVPAMSWSYNKNSKVFYWTDVDISQYKSDELPKTIPVMRYNFKTGTYTVWDAEVKEATTQIKDKTYTYTEIFKETNHKITTEQDAAKQTYSNAVIDYRNALAAAKQ